MTLQESYKILRRYQDWRNGYDLRSLERGELSSMGGACNADQIGECRRFEPEVE